MSSSTRSIALQAPAESGWEQFCKWVTSTNNRLYVGWFGTLMIPTLLAATNAANSSAPARNTTAVTLGAPYGSALLLSHHSSGANALMQTPAIIPRMQASVLSPPTIHPNQPVNAMLTTTEMMQARNSQLRICALRGSDAEQGGKAPG